MKIRIAHLVMITVIGAALAVASPAPAQADVGAPADAAKYWIAVSTGNYPSVGTTVVQVAFVGDRAGSPLTTLRPPGGFPPGSEKKFGPYSWSTLGAVAYVVLAKESGSDWYAEYVAVTSGTDGTTYRCPVEAWFHDSTPRISPCYLR